MGYFNDLSLRTMTDPREQERLDKRDGLSRRRKAIVRPDYGKVLQELEAKDKAAVVVVRPQEEVNASR